MSDAFRLLRMVSPPLPKTLAPTFRSFRIFKAPFAPSLGVSYRTNISIGPGICLSGTGGHSFCSFNQGVFAFASSELVPERPR